MNRVLDELESISDLISEDTGAAAYALDAFRKAHAPFKNKFIGAKVDLLTLIIASVFNNYDKQKIDDKKLLAYFEKQEKYDEAAQLLLSKARHHFTQGQLNEGEILVYYLRDNFLDKISPRIELVYLTRLTFLYGRKAEYDERLKLSLLALEKLNAMAPKTTWHFNLFTIFCTNIAESYFDNEDFDKAWPYLQQSLDVAETQSIATYNRFNVYSYFAFYYELKTEWKKAAEWHDKIIAILKDDVRYQHYVIQSYLMAATLWYNLLKETAANKTKQQQNLADKMMDYLKQVATRIKKDKKSSHYHLWTMGMARLELYKEDFEKALSYLNKCYPAYSKANHRKALLDCTGLMHRVYYAWGKKTNDAKKLLKAYEFQKKESELVIADWRETNRHKLAAIHATNELQKKELKEKLMQQQMDAINKEMRLTALNLHEKILLLDELKVYVNSLKEKEFEMRQFINTISLKINTIKITEQDKAVLQQKIDTHNTALFKKLADTYPQLTTHEVRICGLLKTGMSNKELSKLYGLSEKGYEQLRYRIKKKMKLKRNDNLVKHLMILGGI